MEHQLTAGTMPTLLQSDPGTLSKTWRKIFTKQATVHRAEQVADRFNLITLQSPSFKGRNWVAGQKIQIAMGAGFATRTYTPIDWDAAAGTTRILGYAHGNGPGSDWISNIRAGDTCDVLGPNTSLDVQRVWGPIVLVGDETSIGLAYALQQPPKQVKIILEVNALENVQAMAQYLRLYDIRFVLKSQDGAHLYEMARELTTAASDNATFVLTGNAQSIQHVRHTLKNLNVTSSRQFSKAYWAERKVGLD
jgi:NADPH-dependent ferric siderophore reductase